MLSSNTLEFEYWEQDSEFQPVKFNITRQVIDKNVVRLKYCFGRVFMTTHVQKGKVYVYNLKEDST